MVRGRPPGKTGGWVGQVAAGSNAYVCMGVTGEGPRGWLLLCISAHTSICAAAMPHSAGP
jgi:hypothetical protein